MERDEMRRQENLTLKRNRNVTLIYPLETIFVFLFFWQTGEGGGHAIQRLKNKTIKIQLWSGKVKWENRKILHDAMLELTERRRR